MCKSPLRHHATTFGHLGLSTSPTLSPPFRHPFRHSFRHHSATSAIIIVSARAHSYCLCITRLRPVTRPSCLSTLVFHAQSVTSLSAELETTRPIFRVKVALLITLGRYRYVSEVCRRTAFEPSHILVLLFLLSCLSLPLGTTLPYSHLTLQ